MAKKIKIYEHKHAKSGKSQYDIWMDKTHIDINTIEGFISIHGIGGQKHDDLIKEIQKIYKQLKIKALKMKRASDTIELNGKTCHVEYELEAGYTQVSCTVNKGTNDVPIWETTQATKQGGEVFFNRDKYTDDGTSLRAAIGEWLLSEEQAIVEKLKAI